MPANSSFYLLIWFTYSYSFCLWDAAYCYKKRYSSFETSSINIRPVRVKGVHEVHLRDKRNNTKRMQRRIMMWLIGRDTERFQMFKFHSSEISPVSQRSVWAKATQKTQLHGKKNHTKTKGRRIIVCGSTFTRYIAFSVKVKRARIGHHYGQGLDGGLWFVWRWFQTSNRSHRFNLDA